MRYVQDGRRLVLLWRSVSVLAGSISSGSSSSSFVAITPVRVLDTRSNLGLTGAFSSLNSRDLQVTGTINTADGSQSVVPTGATAVALNVTVVSPTSPGFLSVRPADATGAPSTSSLNFTAGQVVPNAVTVQIPTSGADSGRIELTYNAFEVVGPTTHLLVDIVGYYQAALPPDGTICVAGGLPGTIVNGFNSIGDVNLKCFRSLVTTFAGSSTSGNADGALPTFTGPENVAVDNTGNVYVADSSSHLIRKITPAGIVTTFAGSTQGFLDAVGVSAKFDTPRGLAVDAVGNVYVADRGNFRIRKITPDGTVTTFAGLSDGYVDDTGTAARFGTINDLAIDSAGNLYAADAGNQKIRKITPGAVVTTLAGSTGGYADGTGAAAQFASPQGIAVDGAGNVYVGDSNNNRIRKITPAGDVTTLAGQATAGTTDATGPSAKFNSPRGVAVDPAGNVYVADTFNNRIRKITPAGVVTTLAGSTVGFLDGVGIAAQFSNPTDLAIDLAGNLYVTDFSNTRIRQIN